MDPTPQEQIQSVLERLLVRGVAERDAVAYFDRTYHPDVVIHESPALPYGGDYVGHDGAVRHAKSFIRAWDSRQRPEQRTLNPRYFIGADEAVVTWRLRVADGSGTRSFPAASHYTFADGLIVESRMFHFDLPAVLEFLARDA